MQQNLRFVGFMVSLIFLPFVFSVDARKEPTLLGAWTPIENINDPHVKEVAEFAVSEHNKQLKTSLKLKSVVKGELLVVSGVNFKLVLETIDPTIDGSTRSRMANLKEFEAVVWELGQRNGIDRSLISFKRSLIR